MRQRLSTLPAPALAGVVRKKSVRDAVAAINNCLYDGATMIDLHLSCLETVSEESLRAIISSTALPVLALNYNTTYALTDAGFSESARVESLLGAVRAGAAGIDMQGYTFHAPSKSGFCGEDVYSFTKGNPREVVTDEAVIARQCALIQTVHDMGAEVLLSCHPGIPMRCEQVVELALFLEKRGPDIIKIVTTAANEDEMLESLKTMLALKREVKTPVAYHANGRAGMASRILNPVFGGQIAFCVDRFDEATSMEQPHLRTAAAAIESLKKIING